MDFCHFQVALFGALSGILGDKPEEHERVFMDTMERLRAVGGDFKRVAAWLVETLCSLSDEMFTIDACKAFVENFVKMCVPKKFRGGA